MTSTLEKTADGVSIGEWAPGTLIDERFALEALAGRGGMGQVYRARDQETGQRVALKLLQGVPSADALQRFHREATLLASLRHPGLVAHVAHGASEQGQPYLVMEWLEGEELARRLARGPLPLGESLSLVRRAAEALAHAHQRDIIHRDLKPSNLFLRGGRPEDVVILDFGLARQVQPAPRAVTRSHTVVGTPGYMAPEQAASQSLVRPAADIFSLGCVLYECLTGQPPFEAPHFAAALAKILFSEPVSLTELRPELPEAVRGLVARMLVKDPRHRLANASALLEALDGLEQGRERVSEVPRLTEREQQLVSVLLVTCPEAPPALGEDPHELLSTLLVPQGGRVARLADGSLVATLLPVRGTATDSAVLGARCALVLQERWPGAVVALVTGLGVLDAHRPVGDVMDKAGRLLRRGEVASSARILLDEVTAGLLGPGFQLTPRDADCFVLREDRSRADTSRPLLGKPTSCVGREQELALLESSMVTCREESSARALLVTAGPGVGKSRLRHELLRRLERQAPPPRVLLGRGDPMLKGLEHGLLGQVLREACGMIDGEDLEARRARLLQRVARHVPEAQVREVAEFLGELCGTAFADEGRPRLRAARAEPQLMGTLMGRALVTFLDAECAQAPVLLVLEDLHWSDALSVTLVDRVLRDLSERPLLVLALARPEVKQLFPGLWARSLQELSLNGLSRKASARLVREVLGSGVSESVLQRTVAQSEGNALLLEELIRAEAEGRGDSAPGTVLAVLQARFTRLEAGARQTLLVASLLGRDFWSSGVAHLLGRAPGDALVRTHLELLVRQEVIEPVPDSRLPAEPEFRFRHALVRDAAYGLLAEPNRVLGHRLAAEWLEAQAEPDVQTLALHHQLGQQPERAALLYARSAERLFEHHDLLGTQRCVAAALACGARGELLSRLRALEVLVSLWREEAPSSLALGARVLDELPVGGTLWCWLCGALVLFSTLQADAEQSRRLREQLLRTTPQPEAVVGYVEGLAHLGTSLLWSEDCLRLSELVERAQQVTAGLLDRQLLVRGHVRMMESQWLYVVRGLPWRSFQRAEASLRDFEDVGSERNVDLLRNVVGLVQVELGDREGAVRRLREAWGGHLRHEQYVLALQARNCLMLALAFSPEQAHRHEALTMAREAPAPDQTRPLLQGLHELFAAQVFLVQGDALQAEAHALRAHALLRPFPPIFALACAVLAQAWCQRGDAARARAMARSGVECLERCGARVYRVHILLALVEACFALGDDAAGEASLREALECLRAYALDFSEPEARERFLTQVPVNVRVRALARERWGEEVA